MDRSKSASGGQARRIGIARAISKAGYCSRSDAARLVEAGRVWLNGRRVRDAEAAVDLGHDRIEIDGQPLAAPARHYVVLNKPRGLVTTARDEQGRDTVYRCFDGSGLPWLAPVGRLDRASEGLLLFSNDPEWAARITDPDTGPDKTYHVQVDTIPDADLLERLVAGIRESDEHLAAKQVRLIRAGAKNAWLEIVLDEGRNRQIRRLLSGFGIAVLRLVRVAIGPLALGELGKGRWRALDRAEVEALAPASPRLAAAPPR
jgi:23S rRNA pseudouridine2605 synthase